MFVSGAFEGWVRVKREKQEEGELKDENLNKGLFANTSHGKSWIVRIKGERKREDENVKSMIIK